ncbi:MAG: hypothetical protein ACJ8EM_08720, partial [Sphingomicrobium sp.]
AKGAQARRRLPVPGEGRMRAARAILIGAGALAVCACASARMHTEAELNTVATACGLALGQVAQDEEEKRLLFVMQAAPTAQQRTCITQWARKNHLKTVLIEGVEFAQ